MRKQQVFRHKCRHTCELRVVEHAQDLHRLEPNNVPAGDRGPEHRVPPLAEELFPTDSCWERENQV